MSRVNQFKSGQTFFNQEMFSSEEKIHTVSFHELYKTV